MSAADPTVSVIIPTYNRAAIIPRAIDSALRQTFRPQEILVVDDGSSDDTANVVQSYGPPVRYLRQDNAGPSAARNAGIRAAAGDWVAFLDSDDEWLPEKLAVQMAAVREFPGIQVHVTNGTVVISGQPPVDFFRARGCGDLGGDSGVMARPLPLVLKQTFLTASYTVRRQTLLATGLFDTGMRMFEDLDLFARLALGTPWGVSNRALVRQYHQDGGSLTSLAIDQPVKSRLNVVRAAEKLSRDSRLSPQDAALVARFLAASRFQLGMAYKKCGHKRQAVRCMLESTREDRSLRSWTRVMTAIVLGDAGLKLIGLLGLRRGRGFRREDYLPQGQA